MYGFDKKKSLPNDKFVQWIPSQNKKSAIIGPMNYSKISGTMIANTTAIKGVFERIFVQFTKLIKRKAFLHLYKGEGMDEMEFQEAGRNMRDLIWEYQAKQDAVVDSDASV